MYYLIYKTVNLTNGKIYIGCHRTNNLDDGYLGSGKRLNRAIQKYGKDNFQRYILAVLDSAQQMYDMEASIVDEQFVARDDTYNLTVGGDNGMMYVNETGQNLYGENGQPGHGFENLIDGSTLKQRYLEQGCWNTFIQARKQSVAKHFETNPGHFKGKKHTEQSKTKIGEQNRVQQLGQNNSQYGTCWIYDPSNKINKKINKQDLQSWIDSGWIKGRKIKQSS